MAIAKVGRASRMLDAGSLILVAAGGLLYLNAYFGMQELRNRPHTDFVRGETVAFERLAAHARLLRTSRIGLGIAALGVLVGVSAAIHAHTRRARGARAHI
jgi:hypothetical protein